MSVAVLVRDATAADAVAIGSIHVRCWQYAYADLVPAELLDALDEQQRTERWRTRLEAGHPPRGVTLVSEDAAGNVTGFISVGECQSDADDPATGELQAVYLEPDCIGQGAGRALITSGTIRMREFGFTRARLDVLPGNVRARHVYEAAGWQAVGEPFVVLHGVHELPHLRYERDLQLRR